MIDNLCHIMLYVFVCTIEVAGVARAWSTLSELSAYPNSRFLPVAKGVWIQSRLD
jgi:cytochrome b561